jgi:hypothetical protein
VTQASQVFSISAPRKPEGQKVLDELALVCAQAALGRMIKEAEALHQNVQVPEIIGV